ncbi:hypothetical protein GW17_00054397 [Ensete ventricosum]|nr:hypothetical protein GW17_00054397 [Ensete ventricosum]
MVALGLSRQRAATTIEEGEAAVGRGKGRHWCGQRQRREMALTMPGRVEAAVDRGKGATLVWATTKEEDGNNDGRGGVRLQLTKEKGRR